MRGSFCPAFLRTLCRGTLLLRLPSPESISLFEGADGDAPGGFHGAELCLLTGQKAAEKKEKVPLAQLVKAL